MVCLSTSSSGCSGGLRRRTRNEVETITNIFGKSVFNLFEGSGSMKAKNKKVKLSTIYRLPFQLYAHVFSSDTHNCNRVV